MMRRQSVRSEMCWNREGGVGIPCVRLVDGMLAPCGYCILWRCAALSPRERKDGYRIPSVATQTLSVPS